MASQRNTSEAQVHFRYQQDKISNMSVFHDLAHVFVKAIYELQFGLLWDEAAI